VAADVTLSEKINLVLNNVKIDVKKNNNTVFSDINLDIKMFFETFFEMFLKTSTSMSRPFCDIDFEIHHTQYIVHNMSYIIHHIQYTVYYTSYTIHHTL